VLFLCFSVSLSDNYKIVDGGFERKFFLDVIPGGSQTPCVLFLGAVISLYDNDQVNGNVNRDQLFKASYVKLFQAMRRIVSAVHNTEPCEQVFNDVSTGAKVAEAAVAFLFGYRVAPVGTKGRRGAYWPALVTGKVERQMRRLYQVHGLALIQVF
jgi:hypothetical protein